MKKKIIISSFISLLLGVFSFIIIVSIATSFIFAAVSVLSSDNSDNKNNYLNQNNEMLTPSINGFKPVLKSFMVTAVAWYYPASFGGGWHPGIDMASLGGSIGDPVYAPANSYVLFAGNGGGYGNFVVLLHEIDGVTYSTLYGHLNSYQVKAGDNVKAGKQFARLGNTGNSTGPHVHMEIFRHNYSQAKALAYYNKSRDYMFGLPYSQKGNCSNVCRLAPHQVYKYEYGKIYHNKIN